jgi:hypothetical protein
MTDYAYFVSHIDNMTCITLSTSVSVPQRSPDLKNGLLSRVSVNPYFVRNNLFLGLFFKLVHETNFENFVASRDEFATATAILATWLGFW